MKGYKGFEPGLICRGKQYAENTVFEEEEAEICSCGMHFCENPFDVLGYYGFTNDNGDFNEFAEVEALDEVKTDDNRKFCTKKLKIGAKLSISKFINACVDFAIEKTSTCIADNKISSGDFAQIGSSGNSAKIGSSGDFAKIGNTDFFTTDGKLHTVNKWDLIIAHPPCTYLSIACTQGHTLKNALYNKYQTELC